MSETKNKRMDLNFGGVIENGVFILGLILMYSKTVDLLSAFAPSKFLGYAGNEAIYGACVGLMVEGVVIAVKLTLDRSKTASAWLWGVITMLVPFAISGLAQVFDSFVVRETLAQQPAEIQFLVNWGVPSVPTVIAGLLIIKRIIETRPVEDEPAPKPTFAKVSTNGHDREAAKQTLANPTQPALTTREPKQ